MYRKIVEVRATAPGEVVMWRPLCQGRFEPAHGMLHLGFTTMLTDAITNMWRACQDVDASCERVVRCPNGVLSTYFRIDFISRDFYVEAERRMAFGINAERSRNYLATCLLIGEREDVVDGLLRRYRELGPEPHRTIGSP